MPVPPAAALVIGLALGMAPAAATIELPPPRTDGDAALERALAGRESLRRFRRAPLTLAEAGQLLWAAQGARGRRGGRTAPSAGALYPLALHLVAGEVQGLAPGGYRYDVARHRLEPGVAGDLRARLAAAALGQDCVGGAPAVLVVSAVETRTTGKYGGRGVRYVHMEAGHAAQNVLLQATALGLGAVPVGAFDDAAVAELLGLTNGEAVTAPSLAHGPRLGPIGESADGASLHRGPRLGPIGETPLYLLPVGRP